MHLLDVWSCVVVHLLSSLLCPPHLSAAIDRPTTYPTRPAIDREEAQRLRAQLSASTKEFALEKESALRRRGDELAQRTEECEALRRQLAEATEQLGRARARAETAESDLREREHELTEVGPRRERSYYKYIQKA